MLKLDPIPSNPNQMNGQPCIRDLHPTVRRLLELLATYPDRQQLFQQFPELEEDRQQAVIFASSYVGDRCSCMAVLRLRSALGRSWVERSRNPV